MTHRYLNTSLLLGALGVSGVVFAQSSSPEVMEVTAPRLDRELYTTPAAVSVIEHDKIAQGQQRVRLDESLGTVPGVFLQNRDNFAQGERLAIRGFGARAPFGVRGVTVMADGIPYTLPDGQAQLDAIDLDSAERIEVIRGPSSVLYGNAAGGVLSVTTADGRDDQKTRLGAEIGSDGYQKYRFSDGGVNGPWSHHVSVSALNFDGYRDQSQVEKYHLNAKVRRELGNDRALTAIVNLLDNPRSEDPGGLTREQVDEDRDQLPSEAYYDPKGLDSGQEVDQQVLGLQYEDLSAGPGELYVKGFYLQRDFEQQMPYVGKSRINYQRDYYGASAEYHQDLLLGELPLRYVVGVDAARQEDDRGRHKTTRQGELTRVADEMQTATSLGVFAQGDLDLTDKLTLSLGARYDHVKMDIDDDFITPDNGDDSGQKNYREWSGSAGLSYRYLPTHQVYANISTSFETPTFSEFANPSEAGGFNPSVEPQKALSREIGLRGNFDSGVDYDLALFSIRTRNELVPYKIEGDPNDRTYYRNAGDTSRDGVELALGWQMTPSWRLDSALTLAKYEFDEYDTQDGSYGGNRIPGLPEQTWVNQLSWQGLDERFATLETQYIGDMVADDANDVEVDDYWLVNLRVGDGWHLGGDTMLKGYVGMRNLFDREHFANVRINANNDRYFEPASGRTVYAGMEVAF